MKSPQNKVSDWLPLLSHGGFALPEHFLDLPDLILTFHSLDIPLCSVRTSQFHFHFLSHELQELVLDECYHKV